MEEEVKLLHFAEFLQEFEEVISRREDKGGEHFCYGNPPQLKKKSYACSFFFLFA